MSNTPLQQDDANDPRGPGAWVAALILIGVGIVFLLQNMGYAIPGNWWALFILIPAVFALIGAWKAYAANGFGAGVIGPLISGIVLVALTLMFLFDLDVDWNVIWPAVLIVIGVLALGRAYSRR